jgi:hypothetical protein
VKALADAISKAEGFGIPGAVPTRAHNPGDLKIPGWTGPKTGTEGISVFSTDEEGWTHLYQQLIRIVNGASHVYTLDMTLQQFGDRWTDTQQGPWITNVIAELQVQGFAVDESSTLREVLT